MYSKKYKILHSAHILSNLNNISKKSLFVGFFQLKCLDFDSLILIKKKTFLLNLRTFICKNTFTKKNKLLPFSFLPSVSQGSLVIIYSIKALPVHETIIDLIDKTKLLPLFFSIQNKIIFFKNLGLLLNKSRTEFLILLIELLDTHNRKINNLFIISNSHLQHLFNL